MKRLFLCICSLLLSYSLFAQTIHWITFIDTTDPNVGQIDVYGRKMLYHYFVDAVNTALESKGYKSDIQDYAGAQVSPENCKDAIEMLEIENPDDIIVFYYIGHGGRPATDSGYMHEHPYPQMCLAQNDESMFIPLEWIDAQLSAKGARLAVTFGMCCNNVSSGISIKEEPEFSPKHAPAYMSSAKTKHIQELFLNMRGHVIATSASPRQVSSCFPICPNPNPRDPSHWRDRYTFAICSFFDTELDKYPNEELTWDKFLKNISWFVDKYSGKQQTPIHDIYVEKAPEVKPKPVKVPKQNEIAKTGQRQEANQVVKQGDAGSREWINELTQHLSTLINVSLPISERQALEKNLSEKLFAENAKVKFLAQDGAVIDKLDVSDWLGILATNPQGDILKVVVDEGTFDSNKKIKELKVREIFKK